MANETLKPTQEELLKAVADVLDEALAEYDQLQKSMGVQEQPVQPEGIDNAVVVADPTKPAPAAPAPVIPNTGAPGEVVPAPAAPSETAASAAPMTKDELSEEEKAAKKKKEEEEEAAAGGKKDEDESSDDEMMEMHKALTAKLEGKGLLKKSVAAVEETVEDTFQKSVDDRFASLTASITEVSETVKRIASTPMPRRGVAGYRPLMKTEGPEAATPLRKGEVVNRLLELRKGGDRSVDTSLINRIETGRLAKGDMERITNLGILG